MRLANPIHPQDTTHVEGQPHADAHSSAVAHGDHLSAVADSVAAGDTVSRSGRPLTPYQVLRMLPKDATPAQQDSAIQAWFHPADIHYSDRPDTLHLPGHGIGRSLKDVDLPQYYRENFFSNAAMYHPELRGEGRYGVAGSPVPYTISGDSFITSLLLGCFIVMTLAYAGSRSFVVRQLKNFIYIPHDTDEGISETAGEVRLQLLVVLLGCLLMGVIYYFYVREYVADTFILTDDYLLMFIYAGTVLAYLLAKTAAYTVTNMVFFGIKKHRQWLKSLMFIYSFTSVALFPLVMLQSYFSLSMENAIYYFLAVLVISKLLIFYRCWIIFFRQNTFFLQIVLYLCALEAVPLAVLWSSLAMITTAMTVTF